MAALQPISDSRAVSSRGVATTETLREFSDGSPAEFTRVVDEKPLTTSAHPSNSFGTFNKGEGLGLRTDSATVDGQGAQVSTFNASGFSFYGLADVLATTSTTTSYGSDYTETINGTAFGGTSSRASWTFSVLAPTAVNFTGNHNFYAARGGSGEYSFSGTNGFVFDDGGESSFSSSFLLAAGTYTFDTQMSANAFATGEEAREGRVTGEFALTLTPVPEPASLLLMSFGLGLLMLGRNKLRGSGQAPV